MGFWKQRGQTLGEGVRAPEFTLSSMDGSAVSLKEKLANGPVLLAFFKVSCPVCQLTFPFLERLHQGGGGRLQVMGISQDNAAATREFNEECGVTFPTLLDAKGYPVSNEFGITNVPTLFLVEQDGTISRAVSGFLKTEMQGLGELTGAALFRPGEYVPEWKAG